MSLTNLAKCPFPYFGGKSQAAPLVWQLLGDPDHYVEPFAGSLAVLLNRPALANRTYYSETVNDSDGLLVNAWRGIQLQPDATAEAASWPVSEADLHARHLRIVRWRAEVDLERLMGDPAWCDPIMAGWWIWGMACWIGSGFCSGQGPWGLDETTGRLVRLASGERVNRKLPHLGNDGRGVNHAGAREPGVNRKLPHLADNGRGVNQAGAREPGVKRQRPYLADNGMGVNHAGAREPGVLSCPEPEEFHPVTMPEIRRWFAFLSARLRHVRIINGDWRRAVTNGASLTLPCRCGGDGYAGIFLDPPYADTAKRSDGLYSNDDLQVAHDVAAWCVEHGDHPQKRIVLAGFDGEHGDRLAAAGWQEYEWFEGGYLRGGMAQQSEQGTQQVRERLWASPACPVPGRPARQMGLFEDEE